MKTILVDAWGTLVTKEGLNNDLLELLDSFPNRKIIVSNADDKEIPKYGMDDLPYDLFTLKHKPNKTDPEFFSKLFKKHKLTSGNVVYFDKNMDAVKAAESLGVSAHKYDDENKDVASIKAFLGESL